MELSFIEILLVLFIAFLVLGPQQLVVYSYKAGKFLGKIKSEIGNLKVLASEQIELKGRTQTSPDKPLHSEQPSAPSTTSSTFGHQTYISKAAVKTPQVFDSAKVPKDDLLNHG